jgi:hypothetical protein
VHLVRPVREVQRAQLRPRFGQRGIARYAGAAVHLDRAVQDVGRGARRGHLDGSDLGTRRAHPGRVDQPGRLEHE